MAQHKSTQRILDCLTEGHCVMDDGDSGTVLVRMTRSQLLDLGVRGFTLSGCDGGVYQMAATGSALVDENPDAEVPGV